MSFCEFYKTKLTKIYFTLTSVEGLTIIDSTLDDINFFGMNIPIRYYKNGRLVEDIIIIENYDTFLEYFKVE